MELPIELWSRDNPLSDEARSAIAESVLCYKAGAYRASLLFAYVAWGLTIRARIIAATCPNGVPLGKWSKLQNDLQNDDVWDQEVFDSTQTQAPAAIFDVPNDVRVQVRYWKDRRNDCAHSKRNQILPAHVEAFWAFIQSNLGRFVPNGSIADLLARIDRHFDRNVTPPGQSLAPLVALIPSSVATADLPQLMKDIQGRLALKLGTVTVPRTDEQVSVFEAIFASGQSQSIAALVSHLVGAPDLFAEFARRHPERLLFFTAHSGLIRGLWRRHIETSTFAALLRNSMIPQDEVPEACKHVVAGMAGDVPAPSDTLDLVKAGWVDALRDFAFGAPCKVNDFSLGNKNAAVVQWLLKHESISPQVAKTLCDVFYSQPYPDRVRDTLRAFFAQDSAKKAEFIAASAQANATPPDSLV